MEEQELRKRRGQAMQKIRPMVIKELNKIMEEHDVMETLEDSIIEALVDAGIDAPCDPDEDPEGVDQAIGLVQDCVDEATAFWHHTCTGPVYALVSFDVETGNRMECEFFMGRPRTFDTPAENWPSWFRVYEGNVNGGDSVIVDSRGAAFG
jgi:hypothetical protein